jgi:hypothetical protein
VSAVTPRARRFAYRTLEIDGPRLTASYDLDGRGFVETVDFEGPGSLEEPAARAVAELWFLVAGLSYYKAGAAREIDLGETPVGPAARRLFDAALRDGLGEYAYRLGLDLGDVEVTGGAPSRAVAASLDERAVLTPFGGGIDSVVTADWIEPAIDQRLFIVSPPTGAFAPLEETAAVTDRPVTRATRTIDESILARRPGDLQGHVPVTAMITLLAATAALADGRGGVVMSNEHSASMPNLLVDGRDVNHQWSKSHVAEVLVAEAIAERVGPGLVVASALRDRSELWVAERFSRLSEYHRVFRSCNRAFAQRRESRAPTWCGECDKCLFIHLVLAPFIERRELADVLGVEPLADPRRLEQLRTLVGLSEDRKPFECVGDPTECGVALRAVAASPEWRDEANVAAIAPLVPGDETIEDMLEPQGVSRAPAAWLR